MTDSTVLVISPTTARHLVIALHRHGRELRRNGTALPRELTTLFDILMSASGLERSDLNAAPEPGEPLAVSYNIAAQRLEVSVTTIRRMCAAGRLPVVALGRRRLIPMDAIMAMVGGGR
jgi:excisionase family DNA binding protein